MRKRIKTPVREAIRQGIEDDSKFELTDAERVHIVTALRHCQTSMGFVAEELSDDEIDALVAKLVLP